MAHQRHKYALDRWHSFIYASQIYLGTLFRSSGFTGVLGVVLVVLVRLVQNPKIIVPHTYITNKNYYLYKYWSKYGLQLQEHLI
jgi:hypothetical protein